MATYSGPSIVDYLNSVGKDSSFAARKKLATDYGIQNYSGTAQQNTQLLNMLRNPALTQASTPQPAAAQAPKLNLPSDYVSSIGTNKDWYDPMSGQSREDFEKSLMGSAAPAAYGSTSTGNVRTDLASLNNLNLNPTAQTTGFQDTFEEKLNAALDRILGMDLSKPYDVTTDPLYSPLKQQYENLGTSAFNNQIGKLAALTGGRPSTAAAAAASQAQNAYAQQFASSVLPQLIDAEQTRRLNEYNALLKQLDALRGLRSDSYNQYRDTVADARYADETAYNRGQDAIRNTGTMTVDDILATIPANSPLRDIKDYSAVIAQTTDPWMKAQLRALRLEKINSDPELKAKYGATAVIPTYQTQDAQQREFENQMAQAEYELDKKYKNAQIENIRIDNARQAAAAAKSKEPDIMTAPLESLGDANQVQSYHDLRNIYFGGGTGIYKDNPYAAYQRMLQYRKENVDVLGEKLYNRLLTELEDYMKVNKTYSGESAQASAYNNILSKAISARNNNQSLDPEMDAVNIIINSNLSEEEQLQMLNQLGIDLSSLQ